MEWDKTRTVDPGRFGKPPVETGKPVQPCYCLPTIDSLDARAPNKQNSTHAEGICKKHAAPKRRAHETSPGCRSAKQKWMGHGSAPILASKHRRHLLFTRTACCIIFYSLLGQSRRFCCPACNSSPLLLSATFYSPCGHPIPPASPMRRENQAQMHDKTGAAIGNAAQHRPGVHMRNR